MNNQYESEKAPSDKARLLLDHIGNELKLLWPQLDAYQELFVVEQEKRRSSFRLVPAQGWVVRNIQTVPMPSSVIAMLPSRCAATVANAQFSRASIRFTTTSAEKVEKVVSPPRKPVTTNKRH